MADPPASGIYMGRAFPATGPQGHRPQGTQDAELSRQFGKAVHAGDAHETHRSRAGGGDRAKGCAQVWGGVRSMRRTCHLQVTFLELQTIPMVPGCRT